MCECVCVCVCVCMCVCVYVCKVCLQRAESSATLLLKHLFTRTFRTPWTGDMTPWTWQNYQVVKLLGSSIWSVLTLERTILNSDVMILKRWSCWFFFSFVRTNSHEKENISTGPKNTLTTHQRWWGVILWGRNLTSTRVNNDVTDKFGWNHFRSRSTVRLNLPNPTLRSIISGSQGPFKFG